MAQGAATPAITTPALTLRCSRYDTTGHSRSLCLIALCQFLQRPSKQLMRQMLYSPVRPLFQCSSSSDNDARLTANFAPANSLIPLVCSPGRLQLMADWRRSGPPDKDEPPSTHFETRAKMQLAQ